MPDSGDLPAQWAQEDTSHIEVAGVSGDPEDFSQPFVIYNDRRQAISKLNKRMMFCVPLVLLNSLLLFSMNLHLMGILLIGWTLLLYLWVVRTFNKNTAPLMQIDQRGITIHGLITHCHMDWDNVKEVRPYTFVYKFIGIDPKSIWKLNASLPVKLFLMNNGMSRVFYRLMGIKLSVVNVPEQYSHFRAEDICEQIQRRKEYYLGLPGGQTTRGLTHESAKLEAAAPDATLQLPDSEIKLKVTNPEE